MNEMPSFAPIDTPVTPNAQNGVLPQAPVENTIQPKPRVSRSRKRFKVTEEFTGSSSVQQHGHIKEMGPFATREKALLCVLEKLRGQGRISVGEEDDFRYPVWGGEMVFKIDEVDGE